MPTTSATDTTTASPPSVPILEASGLVRRFGDRLLLDGVGVEIEPGERLAVVGPTGSGKTLLLRALALLDPLDAGCIRWHGHPVPHEQVPHYRSRVIYLHQRPVLVEGTVEANLRLPFALRAHRHRSFDIEFHRTWLARLQRDETFLAQSQRHLSGGEMQIVALLRAIQLDPEILLLDEPTSALDASAATAVESLVLTWLDEKPASRAVVWVTHDARQAQRLGGRVLTMQNGSLLANGSP